MPSKLYEKIAYLVAEGYEVAIKKGSRDNVIKVRLVKDNYEVSYTMDARGYQYAMSYNFESDEEYLLMALTTLEFKYKSYIQRINGE